jgi:DNA-binding transcriptional ArsR family regulator
MPKPEANRRAAAAAALFAALGDSTRLALVRRLASGPASISTLAACCGGDMTRQGVTKHLRVLATAGIVAGRREGREHVWALNQKKLDDARLALDAVTRHWDDALARLKAHVEDPSGVG